MMCVDNIGIHIAFCTKVPEEAADAQVDDELKWLVFKTVAEEGFEIESIETRLDQVHLFASATPHLPYPIG
jgi:REP element-mobilizing transposase RayT